MIGPDTSRGAEAFAMLAQRYGAAFETVLDVGAGDGSHARAFRDQGRRVSVVDVEPPDWDVTDMEVFVGDFTDRETLPVGRRWDCVWACHVLEHVSDPQRFLRRVREVVVEGGLVALTVPPWKNTVVPRHLTIWTGGLLLYHMILAGFDCRAAHVLRYGYNISIVLKVRRMDQPMVWCGAREFFPPGLERKGRGLEGQVPEDGLNWDVA